MNSDFSKLSRDERDARITALILGELSPDETEQTRQAIAADAELAREYERRKQTIELVRETAVMDRKVSADGTALKLDDERRQRLLERFKTPAPPVAVPRRPRNLWYVPMSLAAALVGLLVVLTDWLGGLHGAREMVRRTPLPDASTVAEFADGSATRAFHWILGAPRYAQIDVAGPGEAVPALKELSAEDRQVAYGLRNERPVLNQPVGGSPKAASGLAIALPAATDASGERRVQISGQFQPTTDLGAEGILVEQFNEQPLRSDFAVGRKLQIDRKPDRPNDFSAIASGPSSDGLGVAKGIADNPTPLAGALPVLAEPDREMKKSITVGASDSTRATAESSGSMIAPTWGATTNGVVNFTVTPSSGFASSSYLLGDVQSLSAASSLGGLPATAPVPAQAPPAPAPNSVYFANVAGYVDTKLPPTANPIASPSKPSSDFVDRYDNGAIVLRDKEVAANTRQKGQQNVALYDNDYDQAAVAAQIQGVGGGGTTFAGVNIAGQKNYRAQAVGGGAFGGGSAQSRMDGSSVASGGFGGGGRDPLGKRLADTAQVAAGSVDGIDRPQASPANAATTRGFYDDNINTGPISDPTMAAGDVNGRFGIQLPRLEGEMRFNRESSPTRGDEESKAVAGPRSYAAEPLQGMDAAGLPVESKDSKAIRATAPAEPRRAEAGAWALRPAIPAQSDGDIGGFVAQIMETKKTDGPTVLSANSFASTITPLSAPTPQFKLRASEVSTLDGSLHQTASPELKELAKNDGENQGLHSLEVAGTNAVVHLSQELSQRQIARDRLALNIGATEPEWQMPIKGTVQVIEEAEAGSSASPNWWGRISGMLGSDVRRGARISVEQPMTDIDPKYRGYALRPASDANFTETELERIQSKAVLGKVIEKLKLDEAWARKQAGEGKLNSEEALAKLKKMVDVKSDSKTTLIDIGVKSRDPAEAARIANTIAEVYRDSRDEERAKMAAHGVVALKQELAKKDEQVARAKEELEQRRKELNGGKAETSPPKPQPGSPTPQPEVLTRDNAFSTFSLNVSDVSFKLAAASLEKGQIPDAAGIRSEEFLNAFDYRDPVPAAGVPVAFAWERARYPFAHNRDALRFSVKTAAQGREGGKPLNIVLLLDNSGSMERADRVRIIQESLRSLAAQLKPQDKLSVVTFSRTATLRADGVAGAQAAEVAKQIGALTPEGGTNLEDALDLAYRTALRHYAAAAVNRVVLLTDGAANLGNVEPKALKAKVEGFRKQGVALDCFGIGWDGFNDDLLEQLSRNGDGRYGFVNTPEEAATEFVGQLAGALRVAASDVKVQVEFNPKRVTAYRQIGYAKHQLTKQQFRDNTVDAAEIGAAEAGNGLYIIETNPRGEGPIATVRARFRIPQTTDYREHEWVVPFGSAVELEQSSVAMRLATGASAFSEWLAGSPFSGEVTTDRLLGLMAGVPEVFGADVRPKKLEWMIRQAKSISGK